VDYISHRYTVDMLKKAFEPIVYPMPGEEQWIKTNGEHVDPPVVRIQLGRPRVVRTRGPHNARTCPRARIEVVNYRGQSMSDVKSLEIYLFI
jgi:hypothetical protein